MPLNYKCNKDLWKLPLFLLSGVTVRSIQCILGVEESRQKASWLFKAKDRAFTLSTDLIGLIFSWQRLLACPQVLGAAPPHRTFPPRRCCDSSFLLCVALRVNTVLLTNTYPTVLPFEKGLYSKAVLPKTSSAYKSYCLLACAPRVYCISWLDACHTLPEWITWAFQRLS